MHPELEAWIALATRDLGPAHRERMRDEIAAHYDDAVSAALARGLGADEAHAAALAALGDPQATARAIRQARPPLVALASPLVARGRSLWASRGHTLCVALLGLLAAVGVQRILGAQTGDMGLPTGIAMIAQVAALTLALCIPLAFDDLDLSAGVVVMLGALIARSHSGPESTALLLNTAPVDLAAALPLALALGAGAGLLNGMLAALLRAPAALITLATGAILALALAQFPLIDNLALGSERRLMLLTPSLALLGVVAALSVAVILLRERRPPDRGRMESDAIPDTTRTLWASLALLLAPLVFLMGMVNFTIGSRFWFGALVAATLALAPVASAILPRAADDAARRERRLRLQRLTLRRGPPLLAGACALCLAAWLALAGQLWTIADRALALIAAPLVLALPIALVVAAILALVRGLMCSPAHKWLARPPLGVPWTHIGRRVAALALCGATAAAVGALAAAQGMRDNTYLLCTSFYVLAPLAGLFVGGQHLLRGRRRAAGALLGALVTAALCTPLGGDNLAQGGLAALLLAALLTIGWGAGRGPAHASDPRPAPSLPSVEEQARRIA